jgi:hypothetical protein
MIGGASANTCDRPLESAGDSVAAKKTATCSWGQDEHQLRASTPPDTIFSLSTDDSRAWLRENVPSEASVTYCDREKPGDKSDQVASQQPRKNHSKASAAKDPSLKYVQESKK